MRTAGILLVLLSSASIALGSPLCCILGTGCCRTKASRGAGDGEEVEARAEKTGGCPHCKEHPPGTPAPKPCPKADGCTCKSDVTGHAPAADHAPLPAVADAVAPALPTPAAATAPATAHRALPPSPAPSPHPLLL
jgi:hypothetical protein